MSPVSRRRAGAGRGSGTGPSPAARLRAAEARKVRSEPPLDALTSRLRRLDGPVDGFKAEAVASYVVEVVAGRGPDADEMLARFSHAAVADPRAATTPLGLQALALLSLHGHRDVRQEAAALVAASDLRDELPAWTGVVGLVRPVQIGVLRTAAGDETVLHLLLDHADPAGGPRHLLTLAASHADHRVHLLDVRVRSADDALDAMAERYDGSADPVWAWGGPQDVLAAADPALRTTAAQPPSVWPVMGVEGGETLMWSLAAHRLEQITGTRLT